MHAITRDTLSALLGGLFPPDLRVTPLPETPGLHALELVSDTGEKIRAVLGLPEGSGPHPAVLYCHAHGNRYDIGIDEIRQGRPALVSAYGPYLLAQGLAFLTIEMPCFGTRRSDTESAAAKRHLWQGTTLFAQMLAEQRAGLDILSSHPLVDANRVGAMGISMGGTLAWWSAALDPRIACVVSMCCFADLGRLIDTNDHDGHGIYMMVPGLARHARTGQIAGLAHQAAQLHCVGLQDWSTPPAAFAQARQDLEETCRRSGAPAPRFYIDPDLDHRETDAMRKEVLEFLTSALS